MSLSAGARHRLQRLNEGNELYNDYGYAYELLESNDLRVMDWGRRSKFESIFSRDGFTPNVATWVVLWVAVYVRDFPSDARRTGWTLWARYPTKAFRDIPKLFQRYQRTWGLYKRVCYCIEEWEWTEQNGWECADHV